LKTDEDEENDDVVEPLIPIKPLGMDDDMNEDDDDSDDDDHRDKPDVDDDDDDEDSNKSDYSDDEDDDEFHLKIQKELLIGFLFYQINIFSPSLTN
jgi:uncharacterized sporulation protein YeaH/YhbH (DUF444 family)